MSYIFKRKNQDGSVTDESVDIERWCWGVIYDDGSELHQFGTDGVFHQTGEIDQDRLAMFCMYKPGDPKKRIDMPFQKGMRLIHKYKNVKPFYLDDFVRVYCFGYKQGDQHHFVFILPDDRIIVSAFENVDLPTYNLTYPHHA